MGQGEEEVQKQCNATQWRPCIQSPPHQSRSVLLCCVQTSALLPFCLVTALARLKASAAEATGERVMPWNAATTCTSHQESPPKVGVTVSLGHLCSGATAHNIQSAALFVCSSDLREHEATPYVDLLAAALSGPHYLCPGADLVFYSWELARLQKHKGQSVSVLS